MSDTHTDGNTAIPVSPVNPVQENEMSAIRNAFDRAASVIAAHSDLSREVASLREQFDGLKRDMDYLRQRNKELDEMLSQVRSQRDEAISRASNLQQELTSANGKVNDLTYANEGKGKEIESLQHELEQTKHDRDTYGMEAMQAKDSLAKAEDTIAKLKATIQETADRLQGLFKAHEPQPEPAPTAYNPPTEVTTPHPEPTNEPWGQPVQAHPEPHPEPEPQAQVNRSW